MLSRVSSIPKGGGDGGVGSGVGGGGGGSTFACHSGGQT